MTNELGGGDCPSPSSSSCSSSTSEDDFKLIIRNLKCTLSASDSFHRFIQFSSSQESVIGDNLPTIQSILIQVILKLLSSVKFKFSTIIDCNGFGRRSGFIEMLHQMDKFYINNSQHWTLIVDETRQSLDKFTAVNKAKYEDLIQFVHLTADHITRNNIRLDLQSFAIIFNTMATSKPTTTLGPGLPASRLDFTPLTILPGRIFNNHVPVIKLANCPTPERSPASLHSKSCLSTHRRRLNFDALEDDGVDGDGDGDETDDSSSLLNNQSSNTSEIDGLTIDYQLIPLELSNIKIYQRPDCYKTLPLSKLKIPPLIPMDSSVPYLIDPRIVNRSIIVKKSIMTIERPVRTIHPNGKITVNLTSTKPDTVETITSPDQDGNPRPTKRKRIVWDLD